MERLRKERLRKETLTERERLREGKDEGKNANLWSFSPCFEGQTFFFLKHFR